MDYESIAELTLAVVQHSVHMVLHQLRQHTEKEGIFQVLVKYYAFNDGCQNVAFW